jgi:hypothetical protein
MFPGSPACLWLLPGKVYLLFCHLRTRNQSGKGGVSACSRVFSLLTEVKSRSG